MNPDELRSELERGELRPAYLVAGTEALLRDDALAALRDAVLAGGPADFNFDRLEGEATTPGALRDALRTLPVMARRRLVLLREPVGNVGRAAWKTTTTALPEVVAALDPAAETVLVVSAGALDRRLAWVKAFRDPAALVLCEPPRARDLSAFVRGEAARQGLAIEADAVEALVERVGPQLMLLRRELEKIALLAGTEARATAAHVRAAVADVAEEPIWDLTDAIGAGRSGEALAVLDKLLHAGAPAPVLLGSLAAHFRKLLRLRHGEAAAGPPFVVRKLRSQAQRYTPPRLERCLGAIHETDELLKGQGAVPSTLALERLVIGLSA